MAREFNHELPVLCLIHCGKQSLERSPREIARTPCRNRLPLVPILNAAQALFAFELRLVQLRSRDVRFGAAHQFCLFGISDQAGLLGRVIGLPNRQHAGFMRRQSAHILDLSKSASL